MGKWNDDVRAWCFPISQYTVFVDRFKRNITDKKFVLDKLADLVEKTLREAKPADQERLILSDFNPCALLGPHDDL